jgi:hypothetical protein
MERESYMRNEFRTIASGKSPLMAVCLMLLWMAIGISPSAGASPPLITVAPQVMVSDGLATRRPFEAWFIFDKSSDPRVPGHAIPAGATIRFVFPKSFTSKPGGVLESVMLTGWAQGGIAAKFTVSLDPTDPRAVVIHFAAPIVPGPAESPGLKAIHPRTNEINPAKPGDHPITIQFVDAGPLSGTTTAVAHVLPKPVPNVAAYNQPHAGKNEE